MHCLLGQLLWAELNCQVWIEWINTKSNPADGLSRLGLQDPWTLRQGWKLDTAVLPLASSLGATVLEFARGLAGPDASLLAALG